MTAACFICAGTAFDHRTSEYRRCRRCGHEVLVATDTQALMVNDPLDREVVEQETALDRFQGAILARCGAASRRRLLVDIGTGSGRFLFHQRARFAHHCGVEITPEAVAFARDTLGLEIVTDIDAVAGPIDVATAWHSLEHFPTPELERLLRALAAKVDADGVVIVSVPNAASFQYRWFGRHFAFFDVPHHLHQFTPGSLDRLFAAQGFARTRTFVSWTYNLFGHAQALLNVVRRDHNHLYYRWKRGRASAGVASDLADAALLPLVLPPALLLATLDALAPARGGVLTCSFAKRRSAP